MEILVTGGAGYIGSHTTLSLLDSGYNVTIIDDLSTGNEKLIPEKALSEEIGIRYFKNKLNFSLVLFNRKAKDLIDYVKTLESDPWQATNIRELNTSGLEASMRIKLYGKNKKTHYINN